MAKKAVILAGGQGTRLRPYTTVLPKPLMPIGDRPILDVAIRQLRRYGFRDLAISVGYLAELVMAYLNNGSRHGVNIRYSREFEPLGTAGPLALIPGLDETFLVMNGDVLTALNFARLVDHHREREALATIAVCRREVKIDYGVIVLNSSYELTDYVEKPVDSYYVSMGVYVLEPEVLRFIEPGKPMNMPNLFLELIKARQPVVAYPYEGYWLDIGRQDDYQRAVEEFELRKEELLGGDLP